MLGQTVVYQQIDPLEADLGFSGTGPFADDILEGIYNTHQLQDHVRTLVEHMKQTHLRDGEFDHLPHNHASRIARQTEGVDRIHHNHVSVRPPLEAL